MIRFLQAERQCSKDPLPIVSCLCWQCWVTVLLEIGANNSGEAHKSAWWEGEWGATQLWLMNLFNEQTVCDKCLFTISDIPDKFSQISRTTLYGIITARLDFHKFYVRRVQNDVHKIQRLAMAWKFLQRHNVHGV